MTTDQPDPDAADTPGVLDYVSLYGRQVGLIGDMYLAVVGSSLIALAVAVLLDGFGFISAGYTGSTGELLGSGLVLAVIGLFGLGVASEGPLTGPAIDADEIQLAIARAIGVLVVCAAGLVAARFLAGPAASIAYPFEVGVETLRIASRAGLLVVLPVGVVGSWLMRDRVPRTRRGIDRAAMLGLWVLTSWLMLASAL